MIIQLKSYTSMCTLIQAETKNIISEFILLHKLKNII